ncbi:uncharacterized protein [Oscarella lobularis]|uniref:uncharacterized protein isoform X2 n=1 Tax=Oscarella lobularis TaxID=121494 RepID=UPI0033131930
MENASPAVRALTISSMVMRGESFDKCKRSSSHQHLPFLKVAYRKTKFTNAQYLCGPRLTYEDVVIMNRNAYYLGYPLFDLNVIPRGRKFASININGMGRQERDMGNFVSETLAALIVDADITAVQEITNSEKLDDAIVRKLGIYSAAVKYKSKVSGQLAFFYKSSDLVAYEGEWRSLKVQGKIYGLYGQFRYITTYPGLETCIHFYNVHLSHGYMRERHKQLDSLRSDILKLKTDCKSIVVAGDLNIGASLTQIRKAKYDTETFMEKLSFMRFHDTGDTTASDKGSRSKESHFDHILVSENTRLLHKYDPIGTREFRQDFFYEKFVPVFERSYRTTRQKARNYDLSDHLPVRFTYQYSPFEAAVAIGTWNLKNFKVNQVTKETEKEGKYADEFTRIFNKFDILALQEINGKEKELYRKNLRIGENSLGIAFNSRVNLVDDCKNIPISGYRSAWGCPFRVGTKIIVVVSAHIKNSQKRPLSTSEQYRKSVVDFVKNSFSNLNVEKVYVVGDFNREPRSGSVPCTHNVNSKWTDTLITTKTVRDWVWDLQWGVEPPHLKSGINGCEVLNTELTADATEPDKFIFSDHTGPIKVFASWKEVSDHLPVMTKFY